MRALLKKPGKHGDGDGLWLYVIKPGQASWYLHYGSRGRPRQMSLGSEKDVSLAEAREKMREARKLLSNGIGPLEQRRETVAAAELEQAQATTFAEAVKAYLDSHAAGWRYARDGGAVRDEARLVRASQVTDGAVFFALSLASEQFGPRPLVVKATEEFCRQIAMLAGQKEVAVSFADRKLEAHRVIAAFAHSRTDEHGHDHDNALGS